MLTTWTLISLIVVLLAIAVAGFAMPDRRTRHHHRPDRTSRGHHHGRHHVAD